MAWLTLSDGRWVYPRLYVLAILLVIASVVWLRELWRKPLFGSAVLIAAGYLTFIGYHTNLQPRYYLVLAPSIVIVLVLALRVLAARALDGGREMRAALFVYAFVLGISLPWLGLGTIGYVLHPQYTFVSAAKGFGAIIAAQPGARRLVVGNQGDELSLWNGVPAICAEYSAEPPEAVLQRYEPGWYVDMLGGKPTPMRRRLEATYRLQERAQYEVFDDPDRHTLALYQLLPR